MRRPRSQLQSIQHAGENGRIPTNPHVFCFLADHSLALPTWLALRTQQAQQRLAPRLIMLVNQPLSEVRDVRSGDELVHAACFLRHMLRWGANISQMTIL